MTSPRQLPTPLSMVIHVAGAHRTKQLYVLWKNERIIVTEAPSTFRHCSDAYPVNHKCVDELDNEYQKGFEDIQTFLHTIGFGKTSNGYTVRTEGNHHILPKQHRSRKINCGPWVPLIKSENNISSEYFPQKWTVYWRGREAVFLACDGAHARLLEREMGHHLALQISNLTYNILDHDVQSDSEVNGLISEQCRDRAIVKQALSRVQYRKLLFCGAQGIWYFPNLSTQEQGDIRPWEPTEKIYAGLRGRKDDPVPWTPYRRTRGDAFTFLPSSSLMWPLPVGPTPKDSHLIERIKRRKEVLDLIQRFWSSFDRKLQGVTSEVTTERLSRMSDLNLMLKRLIDTVGREPMKRMGEVDFTVLLVSKVILLGV